MYMCIVRWKMGCLYASNYNSQLYSKSKLKLCICIWTHMTSPRAPEATLPFKIASSKCWQTAQLSKMLCDDAHLTVQQFKHNIVPSKFPAVSSFFNLLEASTILESTWLFSYDFKNTEHLIALVNSNAASRASNYFYCFNSITVS